MTTLDEKIAELEKGKSAEVGIPEAGPSFYLKRGALQGISSLADLLPNAFNLAKVGYGVSGIPQLLSSATGKPVADYAPDVGRANPVANFLLENFDPTLAEPHRPSAAAGGALGAGVLEGIGAGVGQGPMGIARQAPLAMLGELAKQEVKQGVIGALAGGGSEVGAQATGDSTVGRIGGGLLGGVLAPSSFLRQGGVTVGGVRATANTLNDIKSKYPDASANIFQKYIQGNMENSVAGTPDAAKNITDALALRSKIPGFNPSVPEMANSPGMLDMQRRFTTLNAENLNSEVARTSADKAAIKAYYDSIVPAAESPSGVRSEVNQSLSDKIKSLEAQGEQVAGQLPKADQFGIGEGLASIAQGERKAARGPINAAYQSAFDTAGNVKVDAAPIVSAVEDVLGSRLSQLKPENTPQTAATIKRIFGDKSSELTGRSIPPDLMDAAGMAGPKGVSLQDLHDIRVAIGQDMASAKRSFDPTAATRLYNLNKVLPEVDAAIAKMPTGAVDAYASAVNKYKTEYAPRFKEGTPGQVFRDKSVNEPRILPDRFVSEFMKPDVQAGVTRADQFGKLFGANAEAKGLAKTGILDLYRQKVVDPQTGTINMAAHNRFMRDHERTLDAWGRNGVDAATELKGIGQQAAKVEEASTKLNSLAKSLSFETVDDLANSALSSPKVMGNVALNLGAEGRKTFGSMLLNKAWEKGTGAGMSEFLNQNNKTLKMIVPEKQLNDLRDISKALEISERSPVHGVVASGGADALKNATGVSMPTVFSQMRAVTGGRSSVEWAAINLALPAVNKLSQHSFSSVMQQALHDPKTAQNLRDLLITKNPAAQTSAASRLVAGLKNTGSVMWSARGPIISNFIGPERYGENLGRAGSAIQSGAQPDQQ